VIACVVFGVTALEGAEGAPVPSVLVARTLNVYVVPFVSPVIVSGLAAPLIWAPSGEAVTV
jgi:hypothetical protein